MGLGSYPDLSLAKARKAALEAKELLAQGIDPKEQREQELLQQGSLTAHTLEKVSQEWFELKKASINDEYADDIWRSLEMHVFPKLGSRPIGMITAPTTIETLRPLEAKGSLETVKRVIQRLNEVMTYAVNGGLIFANPLSGIKANFKKPQKEHLAALMPDELPELMATTANASIKRTARALIEWQLHTMTRPSEAAGTRWEEIDRSAGIWTIPADRMKRRREHKIPLTNQALAILDVMEPMSGHWDHVFPSDKNPRTHWHTQSANMALKRMGFGGRLVSHGLRSLASTTMNQEGFDSELIEVCLAHIDKNQIRATYDRTDYLERRRPIMEWWSNTIEESAQGSLSIAGGKVLAPGPPETKTRKLSIQ